MVRDAIAFAGKLERDNQLAAKLGCNLQAPVPPIGDLLESEIADAVLHVFTRDSEI